MTGSRLLAELNVPLAALLAFWLVVLAVVAGCGFVHRAPVSPCEDMICEAVDFGDAVRVQVCAGPADLQRIRSEARQLRVLKAAAGIRPEAQQRGDQ